MGPQKLSKEQESLLVALLNSKTNDDAARVAGVARSTMYRWMNNPTFMAAYRNARRIVFDEAIAILQKGSRRAAHVFVERLESEREAVASGRAIFENIFKHREFVELEERFEQMEARMEARIAQATGVSTDPEAPPPSPEAIRTEWMTLVGYDADSIAESIRADRPQSVKEEQYLLDSVRRMLEEQ